MPKFFFKEMHMHTGPIYIFLYLPLEKKKKNCHMMCILSLGLKFIILKCEKIYGHKLLRFLWGNKGMSDGCSNPGVPSLGRAELDAACENFSNIISTSPDHTIYKGTLSNGSEIAVVSTTMSADNWMDISENQFKLKVRL